MKKVMMAAPAMLCAVASAQTFTVDSVDSFQLGSFEELEGFSAETFEGGVRLTGEVLGLDALDSTTGGMNVGAFGLYSGVTDMQLLEVVFDVEVVNNRITSPTTLGDDDEDDYYEGLGSGGEDDDDDDDRGFEDLGFNVGELIIDFGSGSRQTGSFLVRTEPGGESGFWSLFLGISFETTDPSGLNYDVLVNNLELRTVDIPAPGSVTAFGALAFGVLGRRRRA